MTMLSLVALSSVCELSSELCHMHLNCVSMSTRQIGQCLLVTSHWSTQSRWNKCMHGRRLERKIIRKVVKWGCSGWLYLTSLSISNCDKQIVHFSLSSSASLARRSFLYLCGRVWISIVSCKETDFNQREFKVNGGTSHLSSTAIGAFFDHSDEAIQSSQQVEWLVCYTLTELREIKYC